MRVLGILDSADMYGKERANMEVYHILKESGKEVFVGMSKFASVKMKQELSFYMCHEFPFPRDLKGFFRPLKYIVCFIKVQFLLYLYIRNVKPDYILIPTEWALSYLYLPLRCSNAKIVFRCGDDPITYRKRGRFLTKIYGYFWRSTILKRVDVLVSNAKYIQKRMKDSGRIDKGFDRLIYNYPPVRHTLASNIRLKKEGVTFGFIGRIVPDKGVKEMLQAAALILDMTNNPFSIIIAGDPNVDEAYVYDLHKIISDARLEAIVTFAGKINNVDSFYKTCDVICIPSIYEEPMANVVAESKSYHKPCIIFNQGGMPEIVENMKTGIVVEQVTSLALSNAMLYYICHPDKAILHGEEAYHSIGYLKLDFDHFVDRWLGVFK